MLPPSMRMIEGALQPALLSLRQVITPLPYFAPTMNPALLRSGTIPTQCALSSRSFGMDRSLAPMISVSTAADSRILLASCSASVSAAKAPADTSNVVKNASGFIILDHSLGEQSLRDMSLHVAGHA